jgi:macrolide-specific efflux system membrane fusion protein
LYDVLIDADNQDRQLMTGMSAQIFFVLGKAENVPLLPVAALGERVPKEDNAQGIAYRVKEMTETRTEEKIIHIGLKNRRFVEIRDGVSVGSTLQTQTQAKVDDKNQRKERNVAPQTGGARL